MKEPEDLVRIIAGEGVRNPRLLEALRAVPRGTFVPANLARQAYQDKPLPIPHDQVTTQPSLVARMVEALGLVGSERVLDIGAGYGWQTALLANLCRFVWAVERFGDVAEAARENLARCGVTNAEVITSDGTKGLPEHAPYHAILVAAAFPSVPRPLEQQLAVGGRLVQPVGPGGREDVVLFEKGARGLVRRRTVTWARFMAPTGSRSSQAFVVTTRGVVTTPRPLEAKKELGASRVRVPTRPQSGQRPCPSRQTGVPFGPGWFLVRCPQRGQPVRKRA